MNNDHEQTMDKERSHMCHKYLPSTQAFKSHRTAALSHKIKKDVFDTA